MTEAKHPTPYNTNVGARNWEKSRWTVVGCFAQKSKVFLAENIKKGNALENAATMPRGGIALYRDVLANVLGDLNGSTIQTAAREPHGLSTSPIEQGQEAMTSAGKGTTKTVETQGRSQEKSSIHDAEEAVNTEPTDGGSADATHKVKKKELIVPTGLLLLPLPSRPKRLRTISAPRTKVQQKQLKPKDEAKKKILYP